MPFTADSGALPPGYRLAKRRLSPSQGPDSRKSQCGGTRRPWHSCDVDQWPAGYKSGWRDSEAWSSLPTLGVKCRDLSVSHRVAAAATRKYCQSSHRYPRVAASRKLLSELLS
eukprot:3273810-Rhodomonas_salina.1